MTVKQPWGNHNGGQLLFGADGYLYIGLGDGGSGGDPHNNGQNLNTLLGSILRIDVNHQGKDKAYRIPQDNPFVGKKNAQPEIWAYGLRNPWRFSFDPENGLLYCADVGQNKLEEINIIKKGKNYGWRIKEGTKDFKANEADGTPLEAPIAEYGRKQGVSVTGGHVYRGKIKELQGVYLYCDYVTNNFWGIRYEGNTLKEHKFLGQYPYNVSSFSQDKKGEIYLCSFAQGNIYKLTGTK